MSTRKRRSPVVIIPPPPPSAPAVVPPKGLPAGAFILPPYQIWPSQVGQDGRIWTASSYQLVPGRFYEYQFSDDNSGTWKHQYVSARRPEPLIHNSWTPFGAGVSHVWDTTGVGGRIFRYVDYTNTPVSSRPGPWSGVPV